MISRFFIDRPIFANVIAIITMLIGGVSVFVLSIEQYPQITPPTVSVTTAYPGADAKVLADTVASRSSRKSTASRACSTCPRPAPATARTT